MTSDSETTGPHRERPKRLKKAIYEEELVRLQRELVHLQDHVKRTGLKMCVIFEGRDAADVDLLDYH